MVHPLHWDVVSEPSRCQRQTSSVRDQRETDHDRDWMGFCLTRASTTKTYTQPQCSSAPVWLGKRLLLIHG